MSIDLSKLSSEEMEEFLVDMTCSNKASNFIKFVASLNNTSGSREEINENPKETLNDIIEIAQDTLDEMTEIKSNF